MRPAWKRFRLSSLPKLASPRKRWGQGLAERIASKTFNPDTHPDQWNLILRRSKEAIPEFFAEYGDRP